jgi:hypothetical protein
MDPKRRRASAFIMPDTVTGRARCKRIASIEMPRSMREDDHAPERSPSALAAPAQGAYAIRGMGASEVTSPSDQSHFAAMLSLSGMDVPQEQLPSLFEGYSHLLQMIGLLDRSAPPEAEPAMTFTPEQR